MKITLVLTYEQELLLSAYCGMTKARFENLLDIYNVKTVNPATTKHFRDAGCLNESGGLSSVGMILMARGLNIIGGRFIPRQPMFPVEDMDSILPMKVVRWEWIKNGIMGLSGVRTAHIKLLINVAKKPGAVLAYHVPGFGYALIKEMLEARLLSLEESFALRMKRCDDGSVKPSLPDSPSANSYSQVSLFGNGQELLREIMKVQGVLDAVQKREYPIETVKGL